MQIKSILAGAAIAWAGSVGSAAVAEQFTTLDGISAEMLSPMEMERVAGEGAVTANLLLAKVFGCSPAHPGSACDRSRHQNHHGIVQATHVVFNIAQNPSP